MGADLILAYAEVPKPFTEGTIGELRLLAGSPPPEIFEAVVEGCGLEMEDDAAQLREDVTDRLKAAVDTVFVEFYHQEGMHREMTILEIRDREYILTGGMSWGDTPTDVYDDVWMAGMLSIFLQKAIEEFDASGIAT